MNTNSSQNNTTDFDLDSILDAPNDELMTEREPTWKNPEDVLYVPIVVTRANLKQLYDQRKGRSVTRAFVNFYHLDDPSQEPFVFSVGWLSLRNQIAALMTHNPFPLACGIVEMHDREPFVDDNGQKHYPLRLVSVNQLEALEQTANARDATHDTTHDTTPPAPPATPAPKYTPPRSGYRSGGQS